MMEIIIKLVVNNIASKSLAASLDGKVDCTEQVEDERMPQSSRIVEDPATYTRQ